MDNEPYTNARLAQEYLGVVAQYSERIKHFVAHQQAISGFGVDIPAYYRAHGNLDGLEIKGTGRNAKRILVLILQKGVADARRIVGEENEAEFREGNLQIGNTDRHCKQYPPMQSWDNGVRSLEGD